MSITTFAVRRLWLAGLFLTTGAIAASAQTQPTHRLELATGETLLGSLVAESDTEWTFRSQGLGELRVPKAGADLVAVPPVTAEPAAQAPGWVKADPVPVEPAPAVVAEQPAAKPSARWRRSLEAGYSYQARGSLVSTHSTYLRGEVVRDTDTGSQSLMVRYLYGEQDSVRNTDKLDVNFNLREQFRGRLAVRNTLSYSYDYLKDISNQFEDIAGFSYTLIDTPALRYAIGPGLALQYSEPTLGQSGFKILGDISHELSWKIVDRVTFTNNASYLFKPEDMTDYRLRANSVLTGQITDHVTANLRYEYEFEAIRPVASGRSDHRVFTTLGYVF